MEWVLLAVGFIVGGAIGWLLASVKTAQRGSAAQLDAEGRIKAAESSVQELRTQVIGLHQTSAQQQEKIRTESELKAAAEARLKEAQANLEDQKKLLEEARLKLADTFNALASDALKSNNQAFITLARSTFETIQAQAKGDLETRHKAVEGLVNPLRESLNRYEKQIMDMEKTRQSAYGVLDEQLRTLAAANQQLQKETGSLATALRAPQVRGRWGEMTLRRVAELTGMSEHCDFAEQETFENETGRQRPDMIVNLPGERRIAVDAKVPLIAFLDAASAGSEADRQKHLSRYGQMVRAHMNQLAARSYWEQLNPTPTMVILFLPGESFFAAALEQDHTLSADAVEKKILLAAPTTLIAILLGVAYGWRQEQVARNAQVISDLGKQLYDRVRTFVTHFEGVGASLERSIESYNKAVGSLESRVLPSARRFKELGAAPGDEISELEPLDESPRALAARDRESTD